MISHCASLISPVHVEPRTIAAPSTVPDRVTHGSNMPPGQLSLSVADGARRGRADPVDLLSTLAMNSDPI